MGSATLTNGSLETVLARIGTRGYPSLRRHQSGVWFWREKGKDRYCGVDLAAAQREWSEYFGPRLAAAMAAPARSRTRRQRLSPEPLVTVAAPQPPTVPTKPRRTVSDLAARLWDVIDSQCTPERRKVYRYELAPFIDKHGGKALDDLAPDDLLSYRASVVKSYKPWTANGRLAVVRRLLALADSLEWVDRPYRLKLLSGVPTGETTPKAWSPEQVKAKLARVAVTNPNLARMLRLQFLCCLRPFSVPEVVHGRGHWEAEGVFVLNRSKTEKKTGEKQRVCFSAEALAELKGIAPEYAGGRAYRDACQTAGGFAPHALRHSACTALANADVADELIECAMGHTLGKVKRVYRPQKYQRTREALSVLAKLVPAIEDTAGEMR
jgi:integrase